MADSSPQLSPMLKYEGSEAGSDVAPALLSPILQPVKPEEPSDADALESGALPGQALATALIGSQQAPVWPWGKKGQRKPKGKAKAAKTSMKNAKSVMKKKPKRVSRIARLSDYKRKGWAYRAVKLGKKDRTSGGLRKADLIFNARGRVVSKKRSQHAKKQFVEKNLDLWKDSIMETRAESGIQGFMKLKKGSGSESSNYDKVHALWKTKVAQRSAQGGA
eukprot:TRINITY_DN32057_c0_g1_i1.p1 TRINITY_DN32057_c0_g1~~TRINITY_DN32057_c0_g1_i1.p1  ORF type:complete len:245 (+),score=45.74 TRINITY_DN32057_c0_g1_i1:78-737(+)